MEINCTEDSRPTLLLVDDDLTLCRVLARALEKRGFAVTLAHDVAEATAKAKENPPEYAVIDLKMPGPSGLTLIATLKVLDEQMRIVVLTGYASIRTTVEAMKLGATHYLAKPVDVSEIVMALHSDNGDVSVPISVQPLSIKRLEWEHIQKVLLENQGNISTTAKRLGLHRSVLQRKLRKRPVRD
ncbi:MAG: response regulator [Gammaproteobacteria bacterium]